MQYRPLGNTGLSVSTISFGAGPVAGLMTSDDLRRQHATVARALGRGINWFDTAAGYGDGRSEANLGSVLRQLGAAEKVYVATKVRLVPDDLGDIAAAVVRSTQRSLQRLRLDRVTLLQLHNSITARRDDEPTSITPDDVLGPRGVLEGMRQLQAAGDVVHVGLTGLGQPDAIGRVVDCGAFATVQTPFNVLDDDYAAAIRQCAEHGMGVFAIRVFAGGALAGREPSDHTLTTRFFPLDVYRRDQQRAGELARQLADRVSLKELAVRYVLGDGRVTNAIVGFASPEEVDEVVDFAAAGPLDESVQGVLVRWQADEANAARH